jgi:hypothetical protein
MGLPGLAGSDKLDNWDAWQAADHAGLQAKAELQALNCWQLAQRLAVAQGHLTPAHAKAGNQVLRAMLAESPAEHLRAYAASLEG